MKDFFISYNKNDEKKAKWIGGCLERSGYSVIIQAWDFQIGNNFIIEMQKAVNNSERVITILSQNYINSEFCQAEWAVTFAKDPTGEKRLLIPIRIEEIKLPGFFSTSIYIDLFGIDEETAQKRLLQAIDNCNCRKPPSFLDAFSPKTTGPDEKMSFDDNGKYDLRNINLGALPPPLTDELQAYYFERLNQSDPKAKDKLIEGNLRLAIRIAKRYCGKCGCSDEYIVSIGIRGLIKAISSFCPNWGLNVRFGSYAARVIENEILMVLRKSCKENIVDSLDLESLADILVLRGTFAENLVGKQLTEVLLDYINNKMDNIEKSIIKCRYGFCGEKMTQQEVSNILGLSLSYVSKVEKRALIKMQNYLDMIE